MNDPTEKLYSAQKRPSTLVLKKHTCVKSSFKLSRQVIHYMHLKLMFTKIDSTIRIRGVSHHGHHLSNVLPGSVSPHEPLNVKGPFHEKHQF